MRHLKFLCTCVILLLTSVAVFAQTQTDRKILGIIKPDLISQFGNAEIRIFIHHPASRLQTDTTYKASCIQSRQRFQFLMQRCTTGCHLIYKLRNIKIGIIQMTVHTGDSILQKLFFIRRYVRKELQF